MADTPAAASPTCVDEPPSGNNIGSLKCPDVAKSVAFRFTGQPQTHLVTLDCGLPAPPPGPDGEPAEPIVRENCVFQIEACGGQGKSYGGRGGFISATIEALPTTTLYIYVGGWGDVFNGGGSGSCGGADAGFNCIRGGGGTDIRTESGGADGSNNLESRLVVAGGGGAGGNCQPRCSGGNGGGVVGARGQNPRTREAGYNGNGKGGTQTTGGACSKSGFQWTGPKAPCNGKLGKGGKSGKAGVGGAGGGGYYGGGAGVFTGGGGSSWSSGIITANTQGDSRCVGNGVLYITPLDQTGLPPSQEPTTGPTLPTMAPSEPTFWPTHTPKPTRISRRHVPTD